MSAGTGNGDTRGSADESASTQEELDYEDIWTPVADEMEVGGL